MNRLVPPIEKPPWTKKLQSLLKNNQHKSTSTAANAPIPAAGAPALAARREAPTS
jgi:hypothetical protein